MKKRVLMTILVALAGTAVSASNALATHANPEVIHLCVGNGGSLKFVVTPGECKGNSVVLDLVSAATVASLQDQVDSLSALLVDVSRAEIEGYDTLTFSGMNLQVVNGTGTTDGSTNGLGNVIVGYNTADVTPADDKSGSHNLVIGDGHTYTKHSGLVAGQGHTLTGELSFAGGGQGNTASGLTSFVAGGTQNVASGFRAFVGGGNDNVATGFRSFVGGGESNTLNGDHSFIGGGQGNIISAGALESFVGGGAANTLGGNHAFIGGGTLNVADGNFTFVGGGSSNSASGDYSFVGGGTADIAGPGVCAWLADANLVAC